MKYDKCVMCENRLKGEVEKFSDAFCCMGCRANFFEVIRVIE